MKQSSREKPSPFVRKAVDDRIVGAAAHRHPVDCEIDVLADVRIVERHEGLEIVRLIPQVQRE